MIPKQMTDLKSGKTKITSLADEAHEAHVAYKLLYGNPVIPATEEDCDSFEFACSKARMLLNHGLDESAVYVEEVRVMRTVHRFKIVDAETQPEPKPEIETETENSKLQTQN